MYIPFISQLRTQRRGDVAGDGGGGDDEGGVGGDEGGSGTGDSDGDDTPTGTPRLVPLSPSSNSSVSLGKSSATAYGYGGGESIVIPCGQLFAGRSAGGGTRDQIFGGRSYGSGYPGITERGVSGRGFPFWFWPVVWSDTAADSQPYLNGSEYGDAYNSSRFGGSLMEATFISNNSSPNTTFHVLSDNSTVTSLIQSIDANCSHYLSLSSSSSPMAFNSGLASAPQPQQAIQYYRASSVVLTLDGYNNSATFSNDTNTTDWPLPSNIDMNLLVCLNQTVALAVPLVDGAFLSSSAALPVASMVLLGMVIQCLLAIA